MDNNNSNGINYLPCLYCFIMTDSFTQFALLLVSYVFSSVFALVSSVFFLILYLSFMSQYTLFKLAIFAKILLILV